VFEAESGTWVAGGMVFVGSLNNPLSTPLQINFTSPGNYNFAFYPAPATGNQQKYRDSYCISQTFGGNGSGDGLKVRGQ
jgi:hypothetical protein